MNSRVSVLGRTVALFGFFACAVVAGAAHAATLEELIDQTLQGENLAGIAWVTVENEQLSTGSAGYRDLESREDVGADARFLVGSLTKVVLATGVLRLAHEGLLELDAPVLTYLPDLFESGDSHGFETVSVRHLLDHTAGLDDARLWQIFSQRADADAPLSAAFPDPGKQLALRSHPGRQFSYSNMGYTLLGMVIEAVTGRRYEDDLETRVLRPLGMTDSSFAFATQADAHRYPKLVWGHVDDGSRIAAAPIFLRPAGQFVTSASDLGRFARFLLSDGIIAGERFIDAGIMASRAKPMGTDASDQGLLAGYALGLARRDRHGVVGNCHGGNTVGFVAMLCVFPDANKAFAYSVNTDSEVADYARLEELFIRALDIPRAVTPESTSMPDDIDDWTGFFALSPNRFEMFRYLDYLFGTLHVTREGDSLKMRSLAGESKSLESAGIYLYRASDRATPTHVLYRDERERATIGTGFVTYKRSSGILYGLSVLSALLGLLALVWAWLSFFVELVRGTVTWNSRSPLYLGCLALLLPVPLFFLQSFLSLGDLTLASGTLALVTAALPIGAAGSLLLQFSRGVTTALDKAHFFFALCLLQWALVLLSQGLIPLRLWL